MLFKHRYEMWLHRSSTRHQFFIRQLREVGTITSNLERDCVLILNWLMGHCTHDVRLCLCQLLGMTRRIVPRFGNIRRHIRSIIKVSSVYSFGTRTWHTNTH